MWGRKITWLIFGLVMCFAPALTVGADAYPPVVEGRTLVFPDDHGAHPEYRTEWWYVTGWAEDEQGQERGFQVTFFRVGTQIGGDNPSLFAPRQLIIAHAAVTDPEQDRLLHAERMQRALEPLAGAEAGHTRAWIDDWHLEWRDDHYHARVAAEDFAFVLRFTPAGPPMLNGREGYSQKAPDPLNASYYYSRPQLALAGTLDIDGRTHQVRGQAWLDHEWSSEILPEEARGWDWIGINLHDGGALMAFQMRDHDGDALWAAATLQSADGTAHVLASEEVVFTPQRTWRSPRTDIAYPVEWTVEVGVRRFTLTPLIDDQELDSSATSGAIYWEGAVRVFEDGAPAGRGYLEMTGHRERLRM